MFWLFCICNILGNRSVAWIYQVYETVLLSDYVVIVLMKSWKISVIIHNKLTSKVK